MDNLGAKVLGFSLKRAPCECMFPRSYGVEEAAGLVELHAVSSQLRLKGALLTQEVCHQDADQVRAARA